MDVFPTKILLATDGSKDSVLAARAAVDLSRKTGAELHVVHAWRTVPSPHFESWINNALEQEARELLEEQMGKIEEYGGRVEEAYLRKGSPHEAIVALAGEIGADLIVMGSRGMGRLKRLAMGSVSEGVVHHAHVPVLLLRGGENAWPPEHIVVGEDGFGPSLKAGELAAALGGFFEADMTLMRVYPELPEIDEEGRRMNPRMTDDELRRAEKELGSRAAGFEATLGSRPRISIAVGDAAVELVETAHGKGRQSTLIAVGNRGLGPIKRLRLGSVSAKVLRAAEGPVLVYPAET